MERKSVRVAVLILSVLCLLGGIFVIIKDLSFFVTRKEGRGAILSVDKISSGYKVSVSYLNLYTNKQITTSVKFKDSYKDKLERLGQNVTIYYSKFFPKQVYIAEMKVIKKGIIAFEVLFILVLAFAIQFGLQGVKRSKSSSAG